MSAHRLATAASAYLQSASHQPIDWYPWGREAFEAAEAHDRPVLLDVGAVWCHWCHVMDGESYEDPALAEFLNENFVCIKVDRDERPDVDARYQRAVQALTRQGGWPLTAFLTSRGEVFYGGTYFPPEGKYGRPSFRTVLESVLAAWRERRDQVSAQASAIRRLVEEDLDEARAGEVGAAALDAAVAQMRAAFDPVHGGFGSQPKFPHPAALSLLLTRWADAPDDDIRTMILRTLDGMASGGIHDQLGGGFHRYSVDAQWIVPHFEKMSYDNSELLRIYADAAAAFGREEYLHVARGIVRWVREVLADPEGGYGASQDADVGLDDDGDYFTWTLDEAAAMLTPEELEIAAARFDIGTAGEMHHDPGRNVLYLAATLPGIALRTGRSEAEVRALLESAMTKLGEARARRPAPFIDRTRYAAWNAMLVSALLHAAPMLDDPWVAEHALRSLERLRGASDADAVPHTPEAGSGFLDDQVQAATAALDAFEHSGDERWLEWARALLERIWRDYLDPGAGGLFDMPRDRGGEGLLPAAAKPVQDSPTPAPNGVAALAAFRLAEHLDAPEWRARGEALVHAFGGSAPALGLHAATYLLAVDRMIHPAAHVVIAGPAGDAEADRMHRRALATFLPRRSVRRLRPEQAGTARLPAPLQAMLHQETGGPAAYLCIGASCRLPARDDAAWAATLAAPR
ncbi:MAG TPA: thioredoxin domain-containing protein [Gemmatimonadales bacterium]|nr:thioredoxin domain-containing protein [Gemmatimonadales bacterium]